MPFKVLSSSYMGEKLAKGEYIDALLRSSKSVFTTKDAALLWGEGRAQTITAWLNKYVLAWNSV